MSSSPEPATLVHRIHEPKAGAPPHPTLFLLHGLGSDEVDLLTLAPDMDDRLFVISLRAPLPNPWSGFQWFDLDAEGAGLDGAGLQRSLDLLSRFIDEAVAHYPIDQNALYVAGFSQGAAVAGALALTREWERLAGAIMLSGFLPPPGHLQYRPPENLTRPFFLAHGTQDQTVPVLYGRLTRALLVTLPVSLTYREYAIGHEVARDEIADLKQWMSDRLRNRAEQR